MRAASLLASNSLSFISACTCSSCVESCCISSLFLCTAADKWSTCSSYAFSLVVISCCWHKQQAVLGDGGGEGHRRCILHLFCQLQDLSLPGLQQLLGCFEVLLKMSLHTSLPSTAVFDMSQLDGPLDKSLEAALQDVILNTTSALHNTLTHLHRFTPCQSQGIRATTHHLLGLIQVPFSSDEKVHLLDGTHQSLHLVAQL
ncbi:hypothetical protein E2C01_020042 [Portunus trituberculatus]|uniref:Uncharacterized protein n=1 Tax=Portunus trituberculatus TaxID=210409 RepID=A0A5B7DYU0_PORTR|nr:hypothetical protein [Portunus trituberculatus]